LLHVSDMVMCCAVLFVFAVMKCWHSYCVVCEILLNVQCLMTGFNDLCVHKCVAATQTLVHVVNVCVVAKDYTTTQNHTFFRRLKKV
jgi:hypothetical protein